MKAAEQAEKDAREAEQAYLDSTGGGDGYPFVHESQAVRHIKIKTDWDEGKSHIDSLSITKKRCKNSPYAAESGAKRYAYFLAIEIRDRDSTSTSVKDVSGTVKLKKTSGSHRFDYDDVQADLDFEIGFNPPEDSNVIPIDPALFEPDEDFDEDTDEEFEFEADDDSYYVANTKNQKKIVLGLDTDYDDEIGDRYEYANLSFWERERRFLQPFRGISISAPTRTITSTRSTMTEISSCFIPTTTIMRTASLSAPHARTVCRFRPQAEGGFIHHRGRRPGHHRHLRRQHRGQLQSGDRRLRRGRR